MGDNSSNKFMALSDIENIDDGNGMREVDDTAREDGDEDEDDVVEAVNADSTVPLC